VPSTASAPLEYAILFCAALLLAPVTQRIYLVALILPAAVLAREMAALPKDAPGRGTARWFGVVALIFFLVPPFVPGRLNQRLLAVWGVDFWATVLLTVTLLLLLRARVRSVS
jgi:hypothetical protein